MRHLASCVRSPALAIALVLPQCGCPNRSIAELPPITSGTETKDIPISADLDLLFVIDNSASTADKQALFAANFPKFVTALDGFSIGRPNLHLAVVDTTVDIGVSGYDTGGGTGCPHPDPADDGLMQNASRLSACTALGSNDYFIVDTANPDGSRNVNYTGQLQDAFSCIAQVGSTGCGFEAQLEAIKRALDGRHPENAGFVRDGAYLGIVILTDEDDASVVNPAVFGPPLLNSDFAVQPEFAYDCDATIDPMNPATYHGCTVRTGSYLQDPASYVTFLRSIKDPSQIFAAAIAGPPPGLATNDMPAQTCTTCGPANNAISTGMLTIPESNAPPQMALEPACSTMIGNDTAIARPAIRIASFLDDLANAGAQTGFYTACQSDYQGALAGMGANLAADISPCLVGPIDPTDANPNNPGTQLQCTVTDVVNKGMADEQQVLIPTCEMADAPNLAVSPACTTAPCPAANAAAPCWWVQQNATTCPAPSSGFAFYVVRSTAPAPGTVVDVQCALTSE